MFVIVDGMKYSPKTVEFIVLKEVQFLKADSEIVLILLFIVKDFSEEQFSNIPVLMAKTLGNDMSDIPLQL